MGSENIIAMSPLRLGSGRRWEVDCAMSIRLLVASSPPVITRYDEALGLTVRMQPLSAGQAGKTLVHGVTITVGPDAAIARF